MSVFVLVCQNIPEYSCILGFTEQKKCKKFKIFRLFYAFSNLKNISQWNWTTEKNVIYIDIIQFSHFNTNGAVILQTS